MRNHLAPGYHRDHLVARKQSYDAGTSRCLRDELTLRILADGVLPCSPEF